MEIENNLIDISVEFLNQKIKCAIELKFKTETQAAHDEGCIASFKDIEALELLCSANKYNFGKFYFITDSKTYINESIRGKVGVRKAFPMHDGAITQENQTFSCTMIRKDKEITEKVTLKNSYKFEWEEVGGWYFLSLDVNK